MDEFNAYLMQVIKCPCGHKFKRHELKAENYRLPLGKFLNKDLRRTGGNAITMEIQCPKCLLWMDSEDAG